MIQPFFNSDGTGVTVFITIIGSDGNHVDPDSWPITNDPAIVLSSHPSANKTVTKIDDGVFKVVWSSLSPALTHGEIIYISIDGAISGTAWTTWVTPIQVVHLPAKVSDTQDIQNRLPAALVSGRIDASVGSMVANTVTASALASDAVTEIQSGLATSAQATAIEADTQDIQNRLPSALVGGRMNASVGSMASDVITAAALASDASSEIADAVCDEVLTGGTHNVPGSLGRRIRTLADTVILKDGDTVAADNAGSINGSNGLGRIKLQPDVGTVCRGQAVRVTGQVRYIEAYDADTQYATVDSGWCSIPEVGDEYTIFSQRTPLIQRINSADEGTIAYPIAKLWEMIEDSDGWRFSEKAVEEIQKTGDIDGYTLEEALKLILSVLAGKVSGGGTAEITFRAADDSKDRVVATITSVGNRTSITLDADG